MEGLIECHRNATFGAVSVLTNTRLPSFFYPPSSESHMIPVICALMLEIVDIGNAVGYNIPSDEVEKLIDRVSYLHKDKVKESVHIPSMLLDAREGRPMEIEGVLG